MNSRARRRRLEFRRDETVRVYIVSLGGYTYIYGSIGISTFEALCHGEGCGFLITKSCRVGYIQIHLAAFTCATCFISLPARNGMERGPRIEPRILRFISFSPRLASLPANVICNFHFFGLGKFCYRKLNSLYMLGDIFK